MHHTDNIETSFPFEVIHVDASSGLFAEGTQILTTVKCGCCLCTSGQAGLDTPLKSCTISAGDLFFYTPSSLVKIDRLSPDFEGIVAVFATEDVIVDTLHSVIDTPGLLQIRVHPLAHLTDEQFDEARWLLCEAEQSLQSISSGNNTMSRLDIRIIYSRCVTYTYEILRIYFRQSPFDERLAQSRQALVFEEFLINVHRDFRMHHEVAYYSDLANLSVKYFSAIIKNASGYAPGTIINHLLDVEARRLLGYRRLSIKEIAAKLNFSTQSSFGKFFKKRTGMSPDNYRLNPRD